MARKNDACLRCSRRQAIKLGAAGAAGLAMGVALPGCGGELTPLTEDVTVTLSDYPALAEVGGAAEITTDAFDHSIWIVREGEQEYRAMSSECNHASCDVDLEGDKFVCPCHGSVFARDGALEEGPASADLLEFDTRLEGDALTIEANG